MATEGSIRPVFNRPRTSPVPAFSFWLDNAVSLTQTHDVRPPLGQLWQLDYANIVMTAAAGGSPHMHIVLNNGTIAPSIALTSSGTAGSSCSWGAFGNGPLVLSNDIYLQLIVEPNGGTCTFESVVSVEPI